MKPNVRTDSESPSLDIKDISLNVEIVESVPKVGISARKVFENLWKYDDPTVLYDDPRYTYDGVISISFFKPNVGVKSSIPSTRIE